MYKKSWFWILFILVSMISAICVINIFPKVMSFVNLDIIMTGEEAISKSREILAKNNWQTKGFRDVAYFSQDNMSQIYIELEGGGKEKYNSLLNVDYYSPYYWQVRSFKEKEATESWTSFRPDGTPYEFLIKLPEDLFIENVSEDSARVLAELTAKEWNVNLSNYKLIETKKNKVLSGRIDRTFVYERTKDNIKDSTFRVSVTISGSQPTAIHNFIKLPENFYKKYQEMRSANNLIAMGANMAMLIFYGLFGIVVGSFFLIRSKQFMCKQAVFWGIFVATLEFIAGFNYLPISWMWYKTTISSGAFVTQFIFSQITSYLQNIVLLSITFMVAESLTRVAFPKHIQFWRIWNKENGSSLRVLGNTIGGYLVITLELMFVMSFYLVTSKYFGWWNPSSTSIDPNTVAMPFPFLQSIAKALHAGFWEESLFRAIPLAGMVILGRKFNKEKLFLIIGLIGQAIIFGAGHANYMAQPAYARLVELIIPSFIFAFLYLRFGLLTGIIMHFAFDATLMSIPIWVTDSNSMIINRVFFVILFLTPLLIVIIRRIQKGYWNSEKSLQLNEQWKPVHVDSYEEIKPKENSAFNPKMKLYFIIAGVIGVVLFAVFTQFSPNAKKIEITKSEAISIAKDYLKKNHIILDDNWRFLVNVDDKVTSQDKMIWQSLGKDDYEQMSGKFIKASEFNVRVVRFTGSIEERSEEFFFSIYGNGEIRTFYHQIPENREAIELNDNIVKEIAKTKMFEIFGLEENEYEEISFSPNKKPNRIDWTFVYRDTKNYHFDKGEIRYRIDISGEEVSSFNKFYYIEEATSREFESKMTPISMITTLLRLLQLILIFIVLVFSLLKWTKKEFSVKHFLMIFIILILISLFRILNNLPLLISIFNTSEPLKNQYINLVLRSLMTVLLLPFVYSLVGGNVVTNLKNKIKLNPIYPILTGIFLFGLVALLDNYYFSLTPYKADLTILGTFMPVFGFLKILDKFFLSAFYSFTALILLTLANENIKKSFWATIFMSFFMSLIFVGLFRLVFFQTSNLIYWILYSGVITVFVYKVYRNLLYFNSVSTIWVVFGFTFMKLISEIIANIYPGVIFINIISIAILGMVSYIFSRIFILKES